MNASTDRIRLAKLDEVIYRSFARGRTLEQAIGDAAAVSALGDSMHQWTRAEIDAAADKAYGEEK